MLFCCCGLISAQTKTVVTQFGKKVLIYPNANNGLTPESASGNMQLGGILLKPTKLTTSGTNTLSIEGLQAGNTRDKLVVADATGVLKAVSPIQNIGSMNIVRKNTNYTVDENTDNVILADASNGNIIITIPTAVDKGRIFTIKRVDDNSLNSVTIKFINATIDETDTSVLVGSKVTFQFIKENESKWQTLSIF